jgi:Zn-dependent protease with chaperone function
MIGLPAMQSFADRYQVVIAYDGGAETVAEAHGVFGPHITIGPRFGLLSRTEQWAVLLHELGHLRSEHRLIRWLTLPLFWTQWAALLRHRHECEADRFAVAEGYGAPLATYLERYSAPDAQDRARRIHQLLQESIHVACQTA